eukprot:gene3277-1608_t
MAKFQVSPPEKFTFKPEEWSKWVRRFERLRLASELNEKDEENQVNTLFYYMGDDADDILQSFGMSEADKKKYSTVKQKFEGHFIIKRTVIFERARFNMRVQCEALYDPNKEMKVNADASSYGIGGVVLQKQKDGSWKPISYVSRASTPTEARYNQIEKKCLAFVWTCERSSDYILGKEMIGKTDHKPLIPLLTTYMLDKLPPRTERVINEKKAANNDSCFSYFTKVAGSQKAERQRNCLPTKAARLLQYTTSCKTVSCSGLYRTRSENHESRETRTPTSEVKRNRVQIMPLPPSPPTAATTLSEESSKSVSQDVPPLKISSRSKRLIKPSRKALENIGI